MSHYRRPRFRRVPEAHGEDFTDGGRRQSPDGGHGDHKDLVRRVPNIEHTANLFAVCIYRHTAKKSEQTPSWLADGVGGSSPGACAVDTRQTYRLRRAPEQQTHGKPSGFTVCPSGRHTAKLQGAHGEVWSLCRVLGFGTRQSLVPGRPIRSLCRVPWLRHTAKRPKKPCFCFLFFRFKGPHSNICQYIYHKQHARHYI